ncbi:MAG: hypothetical protein CO149_06150 [Nitrospirae bacterium CG_4_9_14_3_um_filter_51_5]|nr:MAG: hypothetical protein CO149_06150 [Nitrospirae bacterium CG_4_9_14_3_um_filter_51_5]
MWIHESHTKKLREYSKLVLTLAEGRPALRPLEGKAANRMVHPDGGTTIIGWAERTKEYVSTATWQERRRPASRRSSGAGTAAPSARHRA